MTSRHIEIRPDNVNSDATISFKGGFPVLSFTIQAQNAVLDPRSIRVNGAVQFMRGFAGGVAVPVRVADGGGGSVGAITMDNRLGVYALWDQLVVRHVKSQQIVEHIRHYNKYMEAYQGLSSSLQDKMGHLNQTTLCEPNEDAMFHNVVASAVAPNPARLNEFSCHLPSGVLASGQIINLMESSFGGIRIELHLSPDSNCLFVRNGVIDVNNADAHYILSQLSLSCEVMDIPEDQLSTMASQSSGALEFNTISSLYTSINTSNAQIQFDLGLKSVQSCFMTFAPSANINTLTSNALASTYPSNAADTLVGFDRIQFLKGGSKYPLDYDVKANRVLGTNINPPAPNPSTFSTSDPQIALQFAQAVIPEYMTERTAIGPLNNNRNYNLGLGVGDLNYKKQINGGPLFGIGMRYSQFNSGQDFSTEQWGVSLNSSLTTDNPQSVYIFFKNKTTLVWNENGVQILN
tara:strand:+ start:963 stop:2348 length:1386 start_codon:yes stop_codon:yes gene_type:complete